jgi:micrococcal nuclease
MYFFLARYFIAIELNNYTAVCKRVIDGDTIVCDIDLGFFVILHSQILRFSNINTPELSTPEGIASKEFLKNLVEGKEIVIKTLKPNCQKEKYGRWLAEIYLNCENLNDILVRNNHAVYVKY